MSNGQLADKIAQLLAHGMDAKDMIASLTAEEKNPEKLLGVIIWLLTTEQT